MRTLYTFWLLLLYKLYFLKKKCKQLHNIYISFSTSYKFVAPCGYHSQMNLRRTSAFRAIPVSLASLGFVHLELRPSFSQLPDTWITTTGFFHRIGNKSYSSTWKLVIHYMETVFLARPCPKYSHCLCPRSSMYNWEWLILCHSAGGSSSSNSLMGWHQRWLPTLILAPWWSLFWWHFELPNHFSHIGSPSSPVMNLLFLWYESWDFTK